jgi:RNA polymerase sigma-70 factor (ECF subfamily)
VSDRDLLPALRRGDRDAFDAIFRAHYAALVRLAEGLLPGRGLAEEVVQDVMLELWRRRESLTVQESLRAYLFRATRNRALNRLRHERVEMVSAPLVRSGTVREADAEPNLVEMEIRAALEQALERLPERCREVFTLSRTHGLRYAEIAQALDISVKTVEAQMGKALRLLRQELAPWLPAGGGQDG